MFTPMQRAGFLGASDMPWVMGNKSPEETLRWFQVKVGLRDPDAPTWGMRLGSLVGDAIVDEYERITGETITCRQTVVHSKVNDRFRSTLDGFMPSRQAVIEAKFATPFFDRDQLFQMYYPQVAMQMHCMQVDVAALVVAQGTNDPFEIECLRSMEYEDEMLVRATAMLLCMDTMTPPVDIPVPTVVPPEKWRTVDLDRDTPNWGDEMLAHLIVYENSREAAEIHETMGKAAKALVPDDVGRVISDNHIIARNKKNSLVITRRKS